MMSSETTSTGTARAMITATVTLPDGTSATITRAKLPKTWKSVLLNQLPFGTSKLGAEFTAVRQGR